MDWLRDVGYPRLKEIARAEGKPVPELSPRISVQVSAKTVPERERVAGQGTLEQIGADLAQLSAMGATYVTLDTYSGGGEGERAVAGDGGG